MLLKLLLETYIKTTYYIYIRLSIKEHPIHSIIFKIIFLIERFFVKGRFTLVDGISRCIYRSLYLLALYISNTMYLIHIIHISEKRTNFYLKQNIYWQYTFSNTMHGRRIKITLKVCFREEKTENNN